VSVPDLTSEELEAVEPHAEEPRPEAPRGVLVRKPKNSVYTVLLMIALAAIVIGCLMMVLEMAKYGFQWKPPANLRSAVNTIADKYFV
jgi:hypothetical protein